MQTYERIIELMKYLNLNKNSFSEEIGMSSNVTIGRIINEKRTPNPSTLQKIINRFPQVNYDWLLTGEGEMLKNNQQIGDISHSTVVGANVNGNGNKITHNDFADMIELQKGYQDLLKRKDEQIDRLIGLIEKSK
jgi:transcriptional regulator with XRE-family HTH domain